MFKVHTETPALSPPGQRELGLFVEPSGGLCFLAEVVLLAKPGAHAQPGAPAQWAFSRPLPLTIPYPIVPSSTSLAALMMAKCWPRPAPLRAQA